MALVARIDAITAIAARERRDARSIAVFAVRTRDGIEAPLTSAARADQQAFRCRIDERKFGLAAAQRATWLLPIAELEPGQQRLGAAGQKRTHREQHHLIQ